MNTLKGFWADLENEEFAHAYADEFLNILIATQLKVLRGDRSQEEFAQKAGMKQERISLLENVNYSSWSVNTLRRLAHAFDLRLRITFENFSSLIDDIRNLNAAGLQRKTRAQELNEFSRDLLNLNTATQEAPRQSIVIDVPTAQLSLYGHPPITVANAALRSQDTIIERKGFARSAAQSLAEIDSQRYPLTPTRSPYMSAAQSQIGQQATGAGL